jgi:hypothetical protein
MRKIVLPFCLIAPLVVFTVYENILQTHMPDWLMAVIILAFFSALTWLWIIKRQHHTANPVKTKEQEKDDIYHNDFSKVPYMTTGTPDKPMLMTQDLVAQELEEQEKLEALGKTSEGKKAP